MQHHPLACTPAATTHSAGTPIASTGSTCVPSGGGAGIHQRTALLERQGAQVGAPEPHGLELLTSHLASSVGDLVNPQPGTRPATG